MVMKRTNVVTVVVGLILFVVGVTDTSAMYDPEMGRFLQRDPVGYVGDMNFYTFVKNKPAEEVDPWGLYGESIHRDLTADLADMACFQRGIAEKIGTYDYDVDIQHPATKLALKEMSLSLAAKPVALVDPLKAEAMRGKAYAISREIIEWHFPGAGGTAPAGLPTRVHWEDPAASAKVDSAIASCDLAAFGQGLHALQDSYAHSGLPPLGMAIPNAYGHSWKASYRWYHPKRYVPAYLLADADNPYLRGPLARDMADRTFQTIKKFRQQCTDNIKVNGKSLPACKLTKPHDTEPTFKEGDVKHYWEK